AFLLLAVAGAGEGDADQQCQGRKDTNAHSESSLHRFVSYQFGKSVERSRWVSVSPQPGAVARRKAGLLRVVSRNQSDRCANATKSSALIASPLMYTPTFGRANK